MPSATEFSTTPSANTTIGGLSVGEGSTNPGSLNDVDRYIAAVIRDTYDKIPAAGSYLLASGGTLTGDLFRATRGGFLHHSSSGLASGQVYTQAEGTARPAAAEGSIVFYYT